MDDKRRVLLIAATDIELGDHSGFACGVGPVEAAAATARELALRPPVAVVHIGIAGARGITPGGLVIGNESVYCDISAEIPVVDRAEPDAGPAREGARRASGCARPGDRNERIGRRCHAGAFRVEAMEGFGVLRACAQASVPAVEIRAISNEISEDDRSRWRIGRALESLAGALPRVLEAVAE